MMNNLIRVNAQSRTNNGCYARQEDDYQLQNWQSSGNGNQQRNTQLAQLFNNVSLQPERRKPQSSMEHITATMLDMFAQCGFNVDLDSVEHHETHTAFIFITRENMMTDRATIAVQYIRESLQSEIGKGVTSAVKPYGSAYNVVVWVKK